MNVFSDFNLDLLQKALDASAMRQSAIADNIANANTENYKAKTVAFEEELQKALQSGSQSDLERVAARIVEVGGTTLGEDGNNVDLEQEMVEMAKNQLLYNTLIQQTSQKLSNLGYVINEGR